MTETKRAQDRGSAYLKKRVKDKDPAVFELLERGEISTNEAAYRSGVKPRPTELNALRRAWSRASQAERREFVGWLRTKAPGVKATPAATAAAPSIEPLLAADGHLSAVSIKQIGDQATAGGMSHADIMEAMGFKRHDVTLQRALNRETRPRSELAAKIEEWLASPRP